MLDLRVKFISNSAYSISNPAADCVLWSAASGFLGGIVQMSTGQLLKNITGFGWNFLGADMSAGQTPLNARFAVQYYNQTAGISCYGFVSTADLSQFSKNWCSDRSSRLSTLVYSEDHNGLFMSNTRSFDDRFPKLWFLPMKWSVLSQPYLLPGNITIPDIRWWSSDARVRTIASSVTWNP